MRQAVLGALLILGFLAGTLVASANPADRPVAAASELADSVFHDVWKAILKTADINPVLIAAPRDVRRDMFVKGELVLDCCAVPDWRNRDDEKAVQLWSEPIFYTADHLILQDGRQYDIDNPLDLSAYKVGVVQGFSYHKDTTLGELVSRISLAEVFQAVADGEADLTIANHQEFHLRQKQTRLKLVLGPKYHELILRARVHNSRSDLLERVNDAIRKLKKSGEINILTGTRIRNPK